MNPFPDTVFVNQDTVIGHAEPCEVIEALIEGENKEDLVKFQQSRKITLQAKIKNDANK